MGRRGSVVGFLSEIGRAECDEGRPDLARGHFAECMAIAMEIDSPSGITESLEGIAGVAAATGAPIRAARLWGAADALRQEDGSPMSPRESMIFDRQVKTVHDALTPDEFDQAWSQGRAMTLNDAVHLALSNTVAPIPDDQDLPPG